MHTRMPLELESSTQLPEILQGYVSVRSKGGKPLFQAKLDDISSGSNPYHGSRADIDAACKSLDSLGLTVLASSRIGVAVAGKPAAFEALTGGKLVTFERLMHAETDRLRYVTHVDVIGKKQPKARCLGAIHSTKSTELEGVLIERPRMLQAVFPAPIPPIVPSSSARARRA
ncbi:MAG: hypothetical protein HC869_27460, partial [Rhodospirillales bacterium]|nr:hypothetical protein [Rhodospirillales bacterium]